DTIMLHRFFIKEESTLEGTSVTLSYKYPKLSTADYFYWYQQFPGKPPEFLISHSSSGAKGNEKVKGLKIQVENKHIDLQISSAAVTDSAVYYCAVDLQTHFWTNVQQPKLGCHVPDLLGCRFVTATL
uniref:Immunoglobulin V-set domain-containing protein n=1 Tax=Oryzias latipes TaxID=8090 RepID=A0A3B3H850_ORYLA